MERGAFSALRRKLEKEADAQLLKGNNTPFEKRERERKRGLGRGKKGGKSSRVDGGDEKKDRGG